MVFRTSLSVLAVAVFAVSLVDANTPIEMFDMEMTGMTLQAVVSEVSSLPASNADMKHGSDSSIGTFVGGPVGIGRGIYLLSSPPSSTAGGANSKAELDFYVTPDSTVLELQFLYLLAGDKVPVDYDFSDAFDIEFSGRRCQRHGKVGKYTAFNVSAFGEESSFMSSKFVMKCSKRVEPGKPTKMTVKARDTHIGNDNHVSSAVLLYAESLEEEFFRCEPRGGSSCYRPSAPGVCETAPCTGSSYVADMDGGSCCAMVTKLAYSACPGADFSSGSGCCEESSVNSMAVVDSDKCFS